VLKKILFICLLSFFCLTVDGYAVTIHLHNGQIIEGEIVKEGDDFIQVDSGLGVYITYYLDEIKSIEGESNLGDVIEEIKDVPPAVKEIIINQKMDKVEEKIIQEPEPKRTIIQANHPPVSLRKKNPVRAQPTSDRTTIENAVDTHIMQTRQVTLDQLNGVRETIKSFRGNDPLRVASQNFMEADAKVQEKIEQIKDSMSEIKRDLPGYASKAKETASGVALSTKDLLSKSELIGKMPPLTLPLIGILFFFYSIFCFPFMLLAKRLSTGGYWMAWIPPFQVFLFLKMASKPPWWVIFFFIPIVNIIVPFVIWIQIAAYLQKPKILGFLAGLPVFSFILLWYFALADSIPGERKKPLRAKRKSKDQSIGRF